VIKKDKRERERERETRLLGVPYTAVVAACCCCGNRLFLLCESLLWSNEFILESDIIYLCGPEAKNSILVENNNFWGYKSSTYLFEYINRNFKCHGSRRKREQLLIVSPLELFANRVAM
jgi:hypothetical protein